MLVAVVELPETLTSEDGSRLKKVRVTQSHCTGRELRLAILNEIRSGNHDYDHDNFEVDIYHAQKGDFLSLLEESVVETSIANEFGNRVRCTVQEQKKENDVGSFRAIMGRFYAFDAENGIEIGGKRVFVSERGDLQGAGTGVNVWDSAILLARYLEKQPVIVKGKRILELGSGCGLLGIVAGILGANQVVMTDLPYALPLMKLNVGYNYDDIIKSGCEQVVCVECDWFNPQSMSALGSSMVAQEDEQWQADVLLVADCVWLHELVAPLLATLRKLVQEATAPLLVVVSFQRRAAKTHEAFWSGLHSIFTHVEEVDIASMDLEKPEVIHLLECS
mmetsp:Transcript_3808/g.5827  ORF Transcript_3808/g.5827 Transcript_3808/m.5827 type:complete len:334 (-) Transcript_3808:354-1355(-)|eukprot:CAMPEP_0195294808 /NCGR_PEP_ID=MMETSP0707-20130614/15940_1 /TAXON_ID=33640 /ORGANISM="Asterionellopsis glacialis, Strain CCMP134" /LENGTH=333 /DNA_ID=CAMNT_0040355871 /DNA_START=129 /DNA_END=1130 /DNA_ORIENTATION=-